GNTLAEILNNANFKNATREQTSFFAPAEQKCLLWLARHSPIWLMPDQLTLLGLISMLLAGTSYVVARWWPYGLLLVNLCLVINWFGDSLDGTLARFRNKQRPR